MTTYSQEVLDIMVKIGNAKEQIRAVELLISKEVQLLRAHGASWSQVGVALGVSSQSAWERYGLSWEQKEERRRSAAIAKQGNQGILGFMEAMSLPPEKSSVTRKRQRAKKTNQA